MMAAETEAIRTETKDYQAKAKAMLDKRMEDHVSDGRKETTACQDALEAI
jgi:hypothetical protein